MTPEKIRFTRQAMEMSQAAFGTYLGVEENTVWRWEAGIHAPVGQKRDEIVRRYHRARQNERRFYEGEVIPANDETDALYPIEQEDHEGHRD